MRLISFFNAKIIRTSGRVWFIFSSQVMMMINCFCGMVDLRKAFSLISSQDHCQRSWPLWISDMPRAGFAPAQNLSSGLVEWNCVIVITTTPRRYSTISTGSINLTFGNKLEKLKPLFASGSWGSWKYCENIEYYIWRYAYHAHACDDWDGVLWDNAWRFSAVGIN